MHPVERNTLNVFKGLLHELDPDKVGWCIDGGAGIQDFFGVEFHNWGWQTVIVEPQVSWGLLGATEGKCIALEDSALCHIDGHVTLYEGWDGNTHSLDSEWEDVTGHPHKKTGMQVPAIRYQTLLEKYAIADVACLKLDIEGSEWSVIQQFAENHVILPRIVSIEYGGGYARHTGKGGWAKHRFDNVLKCIDVLRACGYTHGAHCEEDVHEFSFARHPRGVWRDEAGYGNLVVWQT